MALLLGQAGRAEGQSLQEFLASAERRNVDARQGAVATEAAQAQAAQGVGGLLPSLSASGGWTHNQYAAVINLPTGTSSGAVPNTQEITIVPLNQLDANLRVELPLLDVSRWFRTAASFSSASAAVAREESTRDQVRRQVVTAYYAFAGARALLDSAKRSTTVAQAQVEQQAVRSRAGVGAELELLRARAEVERNLQVTADAEALLANARRTLESVSGLSPTGEPSLPGDDLHPEPEEASLEARVEELPSVRAAQEEAVAAGRNRMAALATFVPSLSAQFTQRMTNATGFQGEPFLWNAGINFNWRADVALAQGVRLASATEQSAALGTEKVRLQARDQIHSDWQRVTAARVKVRSTRAQVEAAQRAAALAKDRYAAGVATQLDVIQSDRDVLSAEVGEIQARFDLASARAQLHLSAGLPL